MALPDFFIIGAMKCGTSTLQAQLARQDGVFMTTPKEPNFFSDDDIFAKGRAWYEGLFADAPADALKGEASTHYTKLPTYPETLPRMQEILPNPPKLIYMIRNPMTRAVSHYIHEWTQGNTGSDVNRAFLDHPEFIDYGCYGMQIVPFVSAYGVENICLTSLESFKADPTKEFQRIVSFLGLSPPIHWVDDLPAQNVSADRARRLPMQELLIDNPVARTLRRTLVPKAIRTRIRESRTMKSRPDFPASLQLRVRDRFLEDREQLLEVFPDHTCIERSYSSLIT